MGRVANFQKKNKRTVFYQHSEDVEQLNVVRIIRYTEDKQNMVGIKNKNISKNSRRDKKKAVEESCCRQKLK